MKNKTITRWRSRLLASTVIAALGALLVVNAHAQNIKVRIGYPSALHGEVIKVLEKTDIAKQHGLDIEATFFQYGPPQIEALSAKSLDVSLTSLVPAASFLAKQPGAITVIAGFGNAAHGLIVPADSPVQKLEDFKGKTIAVAYGSDSYADIAVALKKSGLDLKTDVKLINVPPNEQSAVLEQKLADGVLIRQPALTKLIEKSGAREIRRWPHHLVGIARTEFLTENPEVHAKLTAAFQDAVEFIKKNPQQAAVWFGEQLRQEPAIVERIAAENPLLTPGQAVSIAPSPELKTFGKERAEDLFEFGITKTKVEFIFK